MQQLRLEELLRYTLSGALFLVALLLRGSSIQVGSWTAQNVLGDATKALGLVLLVGSLIYTLHRAVIFPWLLFPSALTLAAVIGAYKFTGDIWVPFRISRIEQEMDSDRFGLRTKKDVLFDVWSEWGSQVHFLYCSAQAVLLAIAFGHILGGYQHLRVLLVMFVVLLAAGLIHQASLIYRVNVVWKERIRNALAAPTANATWERNVESKVIPEA